MADAEIKICLTFKLLDSVKYSNLYYTRQNLFLWYHHSFWIYLYDIQKRKDSVILKEQPFDFMGKWGWGREDKKKIWNPGSDFALKSNEDMVTVIYTCSTLCIRSD